MAKRYPPIHPSFPHFIHGGDYNPEQWIKTPEIWQEDMRLAKLAHVNTMTIGIFSWASLEPEEGKFDFSWMDEIFELLTKNGLHAVLATPSGAKPAWLSAKYPEVLRVQANGQRLLQGGRHNHCFTSPVYREKTQLINRKLAERYGNHPAVLVWHISNEFSGECYCHLCQEAFRKWLRAKYHDDLDALNHAWWTRFWSHTYTDWSQIDPPVPHGETSVHGQNLDWKRFVTDQTIDFIRSEIAPIRELTPNIPITTNLMGTFPGLNYQKIAEVLDVVSWDNYPRWHGPEPDWRLASSVSFVHDINRSLKGGQPFMLMESTPSMTNWMGVSKLKRPGMHLLSSLQAVAHGSDTVQYFQWRKSRGAFEKFHGAVVDHAGHEHTRVFRDVTQVGEVLEKLDPIIGTGVEAQVALIYDWENRWAMEDAKGPRNQYLGYQDTCEAHYRPFWQAGIPVDVVSMDADVSKYKLVIAPMLYMVRPGVAERLEAFVAAGGTLVTTYWSGIVDENDLCFLGGFPGPLRKVTGIWSEEIDALYDEDVNHVVPVAGTQTGLTGSYKAIQLCDLIHAESAQVLATYAEDFYAGRPALTVNAFGSGQAYYIAARTEDDFLRDFYGWLGQQLGLRRALDAQLPVGVTAQVRTDGKTDYVFVMNFTPQPQTVSLGDASSLRSLMDDGVEVTGSIALAPYGVQVLARPHLE
ncbi:MAG: beta-galactosidase [Alicyclobacillus sp.]|nr:beta-galactosidase [Alicyclobacillus sp.]